jgi:membrane fusion protein, multidrug efflux system
MALNSSAYWLSLTSVVVVCGVLSGCSGPSTSEAKAVAGGGRRGGGGDVPATIAKVTTKDVPVELQVIGNVEAYATISVKAQVNGELTKVAFQEGDYVKKGDLLFRIDRRQLEAQLQQMKATQAKSEAMLKQAQAMLARDSAQAEYAKSQAGRYARLTAEGVISKEQNDQTQVASDVAVQGLNADQASIESVKADINSAKANIDNIQVMLTYTDIRSPITGRTGNLATKQGNVITANSMELVTINQVEPIYVTFSVPEAHLPAIKARMAQEKLKVFATPQDSTDPPEVGTLTFIDNSVDASTGTIKLKGTFPNSDHKLWPGEFVRVVLRMSTQQNAAIVPNQAVQTGQDGPYVYVVKDDRSVEVRPVVTGARLDQDLVVEKGLKAGETVVVEGQLRLAPGMKIQVRDASGAPVGGQRRRKKAE